jgi:tetratricopeptide (TPR) repeat protein
MLLLLGTHSWSGLRGTSRLARLRELEPHQPSHELALNVGALTALGAYLAHSAVDFNLHLPGNALLLAFIFGLLANPSVPEPGSALFDDHEEPSTTERPPWWARMPVPALGLWLLISGAPKILPEWYAERARVLARDEYYTQAISMAERGLDRDPKNPNLYYYLGLAYRGRASKSTSSDQQADLEVAERAFRQGIGVFADDEYFWLRLGQTLDNLSKYQEAAAAYQTAIRLDPNYGVLYAHYAVHLKKIGDPEKAQSMLTKGERLGRTSFYTLFHASDRPKQ